VQEIKIAIVEVVSVFDRHNTIWSCCVLFWNFIIIIIIIII